MSEEQSNKDESPVEEVDPFAASNQIIVLAPMDKSIKQITKALLKEPDTYLHEAANSAEIKQIASEAGPCLIVLTVLKKEDVLSTIATLNGLKSMIRENMIKTIILSSFKDQRLADSFFKLGVTEFVANTISANTLFFKVKLQMRALRARRKQLEASDLDRVIGGLSEEEAVDIKVIKSAKDGVPLVQTSATPTASEIGEDIWLFKGEAPKKVGAQWIVNLAGPDPFAGEWTYEETEGETERKWIWKSRNESGEMPQNKDNPSKWAFNGQKPLFNADSGRWKFVGNKPTLSFHKKDELPANKMIPDGKGGILVAPDGKAGEKNLAKLGKIAASVKEKKMHDAASKANAESNKQKEEQAAKAAIVSESLQSTESKKAQEAQPKIAKAAEVRESPESQSTPNLPNLNLKEAKAAAQGAKNLEKNSTNPEEAKLPKAANAKLLKEQDSNTSEEDESAPVAANTIKTRRMAEASQEEAVEEEAAQEDEQENAKKGAHSPKASPNAKKKLDLSEGNKSSDDADESDETGPRAKDKLDKRAAALKGSDEQNSLNAEEDSDAVGENGPTKTVAQTKAALAEKAKSIADAIEKAKAETKIKDEQAEARKQEKAKELKERNERQAKSHAGPGKSLLAQLEEAAEDAGESAQEKNLAASKQKEKFKEKQKPAASKEGRAGNKLLASLEEAGEADGGTLGALTADKKNARAYRPKGSGSVSSSDANEEATSKRESTRSARHPKKIPLSKALNRAKKEEVVYAEYPSGHFGSSQGVWERVDGHGFFFVTPELLALDQETVKNQGPFWYCANDSHESPFYYKDNESWLFPKNAVPSEARTFSDLPEPFANFLLSIAKAKNLANAEQEVNERIDAEAARTEQTLDDPEPADTLIEESQENIQEDIPEEIQEEIQDENGEYSDDALEADSSRSDEELNSDTENAATSTEASESPNDEVTPANEDALQSELKRRERELESAVTSEDAEIEASSENQTERTPESSPQRSPERSKERAERESAELLAATRKEQCEKLAERIAAKAAKKLADGKKEGIDSFVKNLKEKLNADDKNGKSAAAQASKAGDKQKSNKKAGSQLGMFVGLSDRFRNQTIAEACRWLVDQISNTFPGYCVSIFISNPQNIDELKVVASNFNQFVNNELLFRSKEELLIDQRSALKRGVMLHELGYIADTGIVSTGVMLVSTGNDVDEGKAQIFERLARAIGPALFNVQEKGEFAKATRSARKAA